MEPGGCREPLHHGEMHENDESFDRIWSGTSVDNYFVPREASGSYRLRWKRSGSHEEYEGSFVQGIMHGHGTLRSSFGWIYTGHFAHGVRDGHGSWTSCASDELTKHRTTRVKDRSKPRDSYVYYANILFFSLYLSNYSLLAQSLTMQLNL